MSSNVVLKNEICPDLSRCVGFCGGTESCLFCVLLHQKSSIANNIPRRFYAQRGWEHTVLCFPTPPICIVIDSALYNEADGLAGCSKACQLILSSITWVLDGRIVAETTEEAKEQLPLAYSELDKSGWILETKKSDEDRDSSQCEACLGFIIDAARMTVRLGASRRQCVLKHVERDLLSGTCLASCERRSIRR